MGFLTFLNGEYIDSEQAFVSIQDRGFQFGDGIYEVIRCYNGKPFALREHLERLERSAAGIRLPLPYSRTEITEIVEKLVADSGLENADIYMQVTRGYAPRLHQFPKEPKPTFVSYIRPSKPLSPQVRQQGIKVIVVDDNRWYLCHIKSINLLPNVLARQEAEEQGAAEALFEREGVGVIEGSASNLFVVKDGLLITGPDSHLTLGGITREYVLKLAVELGIPFELRFVSRRELCDADEVFVTSTTKEILAVTRIEDHLVGNGEQGEVTKRLCEAFFERITG